MKQERTAIRLTWDGKRKKDSKITKRKEKATSRNREVSSKFVNQSKDTSMEGREITQNGRVMEKKPSPSMERTTEKSRAKLLGENLQDWFFSMKRGGGKGKGYRHTNREERKGAQDVSDAGKLPGALKAIGITLKAGKGGKVTR